MTEENDGLPPSTPAERPSELNDLMELVNRFARPVLTALIVVLILSIGWRVYGQRKQSAEQEALAELFRARATADLQSWVERFPDTGVAPLARLRLASAQYNEGHFSQAITEYKTFLETNSEHLFAPVAELGLCQALEASGQTDTALAGFEKFLTQHAGHFLAPEAVLGKARCLAQQKRYDDARIVCEDLAAERPDSEWSMRAEQTQRTIKRMEAGILPAPTTPSAWTLPGEASSTRSEVVELPWAPAGTATGTAGSNGAPEAATVE